MEEKVPPNDLRSRPWHKMWPSHVPFSLHYPDVPAWHILECNIGLFDERNAIIFLNYEDMSEISRHSYNELYSGSIGLSASLRELSVSKGDRVATVLPNSPALIQSYFGIWLSGGVIVPNSPMSKGEELRKTFVDANIKTVITCRQTFPEVRLACRDLNIQQIMSSLGRPPERNLPEHVIAFEELLENRKARPSLTIDPKEDLAVILYTGGTTGQPKGAMLTHRNIVVNTIQFSQWYAFERGKEVCISVIPMSHSGGMSGVMNVPLYNGATLLVTERAKPSVIGRMAERFHATRLFGVPTLYASLLNDKEACRSDYSSLKACRTGAAPLPVKLKQSFDGLVQREVLVEGYGLTETSPLCLANSIECPKEGSIGIPLPDTEAKVVDLETGKEVSFHQVGELLIRGPQVMKGYLNNPEATAAAFKEGWLRTGDVVRMDEEGFFYIVDRLKDFINASGFKVWPREVEEVLYRYPGVKLAAVIGIPDAYRGENVKAYIVPSADAGNSLNADDIIAYARKHLSAYKAPCLIEFRDELPLSPAGKILRRVLKDENLEKNCGKQH